MTNQEPSEEFTMLAAETIHAVMDTLNPVMSGQILKFGEKMAILMSTISMAIAPIWIGEDKEFKDRVLSTLRDFLNELEEKVFEAKGEGRFCICGKCE